MPGWIKIFAAVLLMALSFSFSAGARSASEVYIVKAADRLAGLEKLFSSIKLPPLEGKKVVIKPNFNSDDPFPATTHLDTLEFVIKKVKDKNPASITIAERSGMGQTDTVLKNRGVYALAGKYGAKVVNLDKLPAEGWVRIDGKGTHWKSGFLAAKVFQSADYVINLCCLKTHRFGGDFTLSLKNNVGAIAKWKPGSPPYNYMLELHTSPHQRRMIAEINRFIPNHLVIMDAMESFADQGPDKGRLIRPGLLLASEDRVAIDAAGVAVLRVYGTTPKVGSGRIFDLDQIKRAAELEIGVKSADQIAIRPLNAQSEDIAGRIRAKLVE
jgi:uncharacterized protein (DUF362 family)